MDPIRFAPRHAPRERGLLLVQVDGLSHEHLGQAIDDGLMPNLKTALESGKYTSSDFHSGLPTQTGVVVAGVLYGRSTLPSNQWLEKKTGEIPNVTGSHSADLIEDSLLASGARGLIEGGSAFLTPLTGNAEHEYFALNDIAATRRAGGKKAVVKQITGEWRHLAWHLAIHPFQAARTLGRFASEFVRGVHQRKRDDIPQDFTHGRLKPALWSALQNVVLTDAAVRAMTARMAKGDPAVFADLPGFDDISHALGPDRAMRSLKAIDRNLGILMKAAAHGDRKYNLVIYGDHGQTANVRFSEQYGQSLGQYVLSLMPGASAPAAHPVEAEPNLPHVHLADTDGDSRMTMLDFGTGAHLYFHFTDEAANGADVEAVYPGVLGKIAAHPGVGFIVTRDGDATEILGKQGRVRVQGGQVQVQGVNPLVQYGHENVTVWQLHDQAHRHGAGDVMAFGGFVGDKIVNFALHPQLGTHGGLGNTQDVAFLIQPAGMGLDMRNVDQSSELYDQLRAHLPSDSPAALP